MKRFGLFSFILTVFLFHSCTVIPVMDEWKDFKGNAWDRKNKVRFVFNIHDTDYYYNLSMNVRVTNDYKYSNLWVNISTTGPEGVKNTEKLMFSLADHRGNWTGHNLGHIISFRLPAIKDRVFTKKGKYTFELEQCMRDTVLKEMVSAGILLEKQQQILK